MPVLFPITAVSVLGELQRLGVTVSLDKSAADPALRVVPKAAINDSVRDLVKANKGALLTYLQECEAGDQLSLSPAAMKSWQERGWYEWKASEKFGADIIIRAMDATAIHELHEGRAVYRTSEILYLQTHDVPLHVFHPLRKALFSKWKDYDRKTNRQIAQMREAAGLGDHHKNKVRKLIGYLCDVGIMEYFEPDQYFPHVETYRIVPPRKRIES